MELNLDLSAFNPIRVPKVKLVHLLLDPGHPEDIPQDMWYRRMEIQAESIRSWHIIAKRLGSYSQRFNRINRTELPVENCADPSIIVTDKNFRGDGLSYGHYGAYLAHRNAILEEFDADTDAILIVEGDTQLNIDPVKMHHEIISAYDFASKNNGAMFTFGDVKFGLNHLSDEMVKDSGRYNKIPHFLCAHCYMILSTEKERIREKILGSKWHAWDIWLYWNYDHDKSVNIFSTKTPLVFEPDGVSMIDYQNKPNNLKG